jgi:hypothetical protein
MTAPVPDRTNKSPRRTSGIGPRYKVSKFKGRVVVEGVSVGDVEDALRLAQRVSEVRHKARESFENFVNSSLLESNEELVPSASQRQVQRTAALRQKLLTEFGAETHETLAQIRDSQPSSVRAWVTRAREQGELFTVKFKGRVLIPKVQLDDEGKLDPAISALVRPLMETDLDGWSIWTWLTHPTGHLSGKIPAELAHVDLERAQRAADLYALDLRNERGEVA